MKKTQTIPAELQAKFEKETKAFYLKQSAAEALPGMDILAFVGWKDAPRIVVKVKTAAEFKAVLAAYPATNEQTTIGTATDKYHTVLNSPFRVDIENPARCNTYSPFLYKIGWQSGDIEMSVEMPIEAAPDFCRRIDRNISDSEYHYFIGVSETKLRSMRVPAYTFNGNCISWYGGNKTLTSESETNDFIEFLTA